MKIQRIFFLSACLGALMMLMAVTGASASPKPVPETIKAVMVGDRLVDVALNLGVLPEAMSVRASMWPKGGELRLGTQLLGCPVRVTKKQPETIGNYMREHGVTRLIIEKSAKFCLYRKVDPMDVVKVVKNVPGLTVEYVDFTQGVVPAIQQVAKLLGKEAKSKELITKYEKNMAKAEKVLASGSVDRRVVVLNGAYSPITGKTFVRVEAPGGYADQYILDPLGCRNAASPMISDASRISKGHVMCKRLKGLAEAKPDVIVMTGDAYAVQLAIADAVRRNPSLAEVPAIKKGAIFSLPFYGDSSVIEYPEIFRQWAMAIKN